MLVNLISLLSSPTFQQQSISFWFTTPQYLKCIKLIQMCKNFSPLRMLVQFAPICIIDSDSKAAKSFSTNSKTTLLNHTSFCKIIHYGIPACSNEHLIQILGENRIPSEMCLPLDATRRDETPPAARLRGKIHHNRAFTFQMKLWFQGGKHNPWSKLGKKRNWEKSSSNTRTNCVLWALLKYFILKMHVM